MAELDKVELVNMYMSLRSMELALIGAGVGGGIKHTSELKVLNYKKAMQSPDVDKWRKEVRNEKARFDKYDALTAVPRSSLPKGAKVLTTTWAMKLKSNGTRRGRLNARGYEQVDGSHYASDSIAAPVTNPITVRIVLMLYCMNRTWISAIIDVEGAFLQGHFANGEELYIEVPDGFHEWYEGDVVLRMNVPLYGTKQAAYCFFKTFASRIKNLTYKQSKADPCLYFAWIGGEMVVFVAWVDDVMVLGPPSLVEQVQRDLEKSFTCKREGELTEYVGSKLTFSRDDNGKGTVKFTQPVLIKKINDEYKLTDGPVSKTPAVASQVLVKGDGEGTVTSDQMKMYRSATATCMFMMQWSRPDIFNAVRGLARHMTW
jgi:hypothetical protein